ncbi:FBP domain-containing protein [Streptomyces violascens]|uniref:FBP domain-containing protein n=1 Tax=Streptomyces violascens TaxID=67381 RepID=UPI003650ED98
MAVPHDLDALPWGDLGFLGRPEPSPPDRANLVTEHAGRLVGVAPRHPSRRRGLLQRSPPEGCGALVPQGEGLWPGGGDKAHRGFGGYYGA